MNIKTLYVITLCFFSMYNSYSQSLTADSLHFSMFNFISYSICSDDSLNLDIDGDNINDLVLWRQQDISPCDFPRTNKYIYISPQNGYQIHYSGFVYGWIQKQQATKIQYGDVITDKNTFIDSICVLHAEIYYGYHCTLNYEFGWNSNDVGFVALRKIYQSDTIYNLVRIQIYNNADCFKIIRPYDFINNKIDTNIELFNAYLVNNILKITVPIDNNEKIIKIVNTLGVICFESKTYQKDMTINIDNFKSGIYIVYILNSNDRKFHTYKIIKN